MQDRSRLTIELLRARVRRFRRRLRAQLCRSSTVLLGLLALGLGEPLLCIIHCELAEVLQELQSRQSMVSMHHHHTMGHMSMPAEPEAAATHSLHQHGPATAGAHTHSQPAADCMMPAGGSGPSPLPPPSPIHDLLLTPLVLLSAALPCAAHLPLSRLRPRYLGKPPPCPPPILAAWPR